MPVSSLPRSRIISSDCLQVQDVYCFCIVHSVFNNYHGEVWISLILCWPLAQASWLLFGMLTHFLKCVLSFISKISPWLSLQLSSYTSSNAGKLIFFKGGTWAKTQLPQEQITYWIHCSRAWGWIIQDVFKPFFLMGHDIQFCNYTDWHQSVSEGQALQGPANRSQLCQKPTR